MSMANTGLVPVGRFMRPHGVKGEIKFESYLVDSSATDLMDLSPLTVVHEKGAAVPVESAEFESARGPIGAEGSGVFIVKLHGYDSPESVKSISGLEVMAERDKVPDLEDESAFYRFDIIGYTVYDISPCQSEEPAKRKKIGTLTDLLSSSAHDIFVIKLDRGGEIAVPAVDEFVLEIDKDNKSITLTRSGEFS